MSKLSIYDISWYNVYTDHALKNNLAKKNKQTFCFDSKKKLSFHNFVEVAQQKLTFPFHSKSIILLEGKQRVKTKNTLSIAIEKTKDKKYFFWTQCDCCTHLKTFPYRILQIQTLIINSNMISLDSLEFENKEGF